MVHADRRIVLGKKSGLDSSDLKASELGLAISAEQRAPILAAVEKRGLVTDQEFREIADTHNGAACDHH